VVAQLLDYAINLREADLSGLPSLPLEAGEDFVDREDVQRRLQEDDFLLVVAADVADDRAAKLTRAVLDRHTIHPWDLALVDLALFAPVDGLPPTELLCVPYVVGGVRCESRHVVEVRVSNTAEKASVVVSLAEEEPAGGRPVAWNGESFRKAFDKASSHVAFRDLALGLLAAAEAVDASSVRYGRKAKYPTAGLQHRGVLFATVDKNGLWLYGRAKLAEAFGVDVAAAHWGEARSPFPEQPEGKPYFQIRATDSRTKAMIDMVGNWLQLPR
jgi:hypothetical protein